MTKIFLICNDSINMEFQALLKDKAEFTNKLDSDVNLIIDTLNFPKEKKIENIKFIDENSSANVPVLISSLCVQVSEVASTSNRPERLIGLGLYNSFSKAKMIEIAPSKITDAGILKNAESILSSLGLNYSIVPDKVGLVFPRTVSMIINEAAQVYSEQIASKEDIDTAMKLGTNYPFGPLEWADRLGVDLVFNILSALQVQSGEERYKPHDSLKEMAELKKKFYS